MATPFAQKSLSIYVTVHPVSPPSPIRITPSLVVQVPLVPTRM
jgi:hypothetical protein